MDKKELLKRWVLAYTEPSLFYIPWKKTKEIEVWINNNHYVDNSHHIIDHSNIGGIFTPDGKLISKVTFNTTSHHGLFIISLKQGTYIYKEAISPNACELSNDVIFTITNHDYPRKFINIQHHTAQSFYTVFYKKNNTNINQLSDISNDESMIIYNSYEIAVRHYVLKDNQKYQEMVIDDTQPLIREITHNKNKDEHYLYNTYSYDYMKKEKKEYEVPGEPKKREVSFSFMHYMEDPVSRVTWYAESYYPYVYAHQKLYGDCLFVHKEYVNLADNDFNSIEKWILNVTKEDLFNLYKFIKDSHIPVDKYEESNPKGEWYRMRYYVYVDTNGNYQASYTENTEFSITAYIYSYQSLGIRLPRSLVYRESNNIPDNILKDYNLILTDYITDTEKYFHQISDTYTPERYGQYMQYLGIDPQPQINQEVLDIINNSESGGES